MVFQTIGKFAIVFVTLIFGKVWFDAVTGPLRESDVDKKLIYISHQRYKGGNRNYCSNFSVTFKTTGKFVIVFVRLILGKVGVDVFTGPRRESDIR